jgi:hypothetical protein
MADWLGAVIATWASSAVRLECTTSHHTTPQHAMRVQVQWLSDCSHMQHSLFTLNCCDLISFCCVLLM